MAGRKSKLTPERQERICELLRAGNYAGVAAKAAGIAESTFYAWIERGEKARTGAFAEFAEAVKKAEAEGETAALEIIQTAALESWQAAAWLLERRFPQRWARANRDTARGETEGFEVLDLEPAKVTDNGN